MNGECEFPMPVWVGITSLPSRIDHIRPTLDSLMDQTRRPDQILLCLPKWSTRENCAYPRPDWLKAYEPILRIVACEKDHGPGTKLLGCLPHIHVPTCLVLADDDLVYAPNFLSILAEHQTREHASSFSFWTYPCGPFTVGQGADGFSIYTPNLKDIWPFAERAVSERTLRLVDDLWISAFLQRQGVKVKSLRDQLPPKQTIYEVAHTINQLQNLEGDLEREKVMAAGTRYLIASGMMGRRMQWVGIAKNLVRRVKTTISGRS